MQDQFKALRTELILKDAQIKAMGQEIETVRRRLAEARAALDELQKRQAAREPA